jgi:hypothetical protein
MVTIAITGIASNLARTVVPRLLSEPSIEKIVGVGSSEKLESKGFKFKYPTTESIVLDVLKRNYGMD